MAAPVTALLYTGMCLFEGTNLNEGRGTETPFEVVGAPWLDAETIIWEIAPEERLGCSLEAVAYTPVSLPGRAADPAYRDQPCRGIRIAVQDPGQVRGFTLAVALIIAVRRRHPADFAWKSIFDVLAGTPELRKQIERGETALQIVERYNTALAAFDRRRPRRYE
jgi:uncharacterized protein YbbC (DUF1343 family)